MSNKDPDTKKATKSIQYLESSNLRGRTKIKISISPDDFFANPLSNIQKHLSDALSIHKQNVLEIEYLINYRNGLQNILEKIRQDGSKINNVEVTNYAHEIIQFKKGFTVGKPLKYINNGQDEDNEMTLLNQYINLCNKQSLDLDKYENIYTTGIAYTLTISQNKDYDVDEESPFIYKVLDNTKTFMVYADDTLETELFSVIISTTNDERNLARETYTCYSKGMCYIFRDAISQPEFIRQSQINISQPITEYCLNQSRIGVFEPILSQLNSFNIIRSNQLDDIEEFVNAFLVFINQDPQNIIDNIDKFRQKRILVLKSNNANFPADIKNIQNELDHSNINEMYNDSKVDAFNIVGVPMATSNTGQGVSGEAQTYGGGWENAQAISSIETTYIKQFENENLKKIIKLCKLDINSGIRKLTTKNIDIKYTINKSNNILVKAQSFKYFIDSGFTAEIALELADVCDDAHLVGTQMDKHIEEQKEKDLKLEIAKQKLLNSIQKVEITEDKKDTKE